MGYCEIGVYRTKSLANVGTLWRSAFQLGAASIFTIGKRFPQQASDTHKTWKHVPMYHFTTLEEWHTALPYGAIVVGVEMGGKPLKTFHHPERAIYLLGAEDNGLSKSAMEYCHRVVSIETVRAESYNVAVAGSIILYDRHRKENG